MFGQPNYMGGYSGYVSGYYPQPMPGQMGQMERTGQMAQISGQQIGQLGQPNYMGQMQGQQMNTLPQSATNSGTGVLWVQDERTALEYPVAPNSAVVLWDINYPVIYKKQADASGKPTTQIYDLVERKATPNQQQTAQVNESYATRAELENTKAELQNLSARLDNLISQTQPRAKRSGGKEDTAKEAADNG